MTNFAFLADLLYIRWKQIPQNCLHILFKLKGQTQDFILKKQPCQNFHQQNRHHFLVMNCNEIPCNQSIVHSLDNFSEFRSDFFCPAYILWSCFFKTLAVHLLLRAIHQQSILFFHRFNKQRNSIMQSNSFFHQTQVKLPVQLMEITESGFVSQTFSQIQIL